MIRKLEARIAAGHSLIRILNGILFFLYLSLLQPCHVYVRHNHRIYLFLSNNFLPVFLSSFLPLLIPGANNPHCCSICQHLMISGKYRDVILHLLWLTLQNPSTLSNNQSTASTWVSMVVGIPCMPQTRRTVRKESYAKQ